MRFRDGALAALTSVIWGFGFVVIKLGFSSFSAPQLTALRFIVAALPVFLVPRPKIAWPRLALIGLTLFTGQFLLLFFAIAAGLPAGLASVTQQTQVFFTVLLAAMFLREIPSLRQGVGMTVASLAVALMRRHGQPGRGAAWQARGRGSGSVAGGMGEPRPAIAGARRRGLSTRIRACRRRSPARRRLGIGCASISARSPRSSPMRSGAISSALFRPRGALRIAGAVTGVVVGAGLRRDLQSAALRRHGADPGRPRRHRLRPSAAERTPGANVSPPRRAKFAGAVPAASGEGDDGQPGQGFRALLFYCRAYEIAYNPDIGLAYNAKD